jgi:hypothetical protein
MMLSHSFPEWVVQLKSLQLSRIKAPPFTAEVLRGVECGSSEAFMQ